jgi:hypothetical protein
MYKSCKYVHTYVENVFTKSPDQCSIYDIVYASKILAMNVLYIVLITPFFPTIIVGGVYAV